MNCPACDSTEFDGSGQCLSCGFSAAVKETPAQGDAGAAPESAPRQEPNEQQLPQDQEQEAAPSEVPEWRQELSRRLQEIKSRREAAAAAAGMRRPPSSAPDESVPARQPAARRPRRISSFPPRDRLVNAHLPELRPPGPVLTSALEGSGGPVPAQSAAPPPPPRDEAGAKEVARPEAPDAAAEIPLRPAPADDAGRSDVKQLIDSVVGARAAAGDSASAPSAPVQAHVEAPIRSEPQIQPDAGQQRRLEFEQAVRPRPEKKPEPELESDLARWMLPIHDTVVEPEPEEDKLILLSRTLSGLVDLIIVVLCAGAIIFAVDILEGIEVWDAVSKIHYGLLLGAIYFLYSLFFLGMANQTIGMMLTDLQVVDRETARASLPRILVRCLLFPLSVALLGAGLLWGCFDRHARCLHDLLSHTRVIRVM